MLKSYNYNYAIVMYDISDTQSEAGKNRVTKVFKICKKYFHHHQKSIFRGNITPSRLIKFRDEIKGVIDEELDFVSIIKLQNKNVFDEEVLGTDEKPSESLFL
ncbi:MAG: CRISPR-associated protein Cas2 [uncultured Sulfurovum sp.]|uniref:CRISPR-associated endoribonuclease Cas2 n=1 Tax=uncultured Sulfurovum sp. TaxID=269237 RepID=A0A6S6SUB7_9BACT|nr:MAG: CRISPR-associated protein Cas2 [uncultured Sulfurovum sp.]